MSGSGSAHIKDAFKVIHESLGPWMNKLNSPMVQSAAGDMITVATLKIAETVVLDIHRIADALESLSRDDQKARDTRKRIEEYNADPS